MCWLIQYNLDLLVTSNNMSTTKFWNVFTHKEFEANGEKKELWFKVGNIKITAQGKKYLQLFQYPNTDFFIFEPRDNEIEEIE